MINLESINQSKRVNDEEGWELKFAEKIHHLLLPHTDMHTQTEDHSETSPMVSLRTE